MDIVVIPFHDYKKWINEGFRTRDAHLCQNFEKKKDIDKILVINRPVSLAERLVKRSLWKTPSGTVVYKKHGVQLSKMSEKTWCLDIALMDFIKVIIQRKMWWFTSFKYKKVCKEINYAIEKLNMKDIVLLLQNPMAVGAVDSINYNKFVFDAIDNWLYHPQMNNKDLIKQNYEYIEKKADLILTVSQALTEVFSKNKNVCWVPNGVDVEYFKISSNNKIENNKTVVGYVGKIQDRVDFNLVEYCLQKFPDTDFVFLGPIYSQKSTVNRLLATYDNIYFKGDIHYNDLPVEMMQFDVAIIPHVVNEFTNSMNPLKLYEYLAAGKIVVTSEVAGTENISPYVFMSTNKDDFVSLLSKAINISKNDSFNSQVVVQSVPDSCKWSNRVDIILQLIKGIQ